MDRRAFLQSIAIAGIATAAPIKVISEIVSRHQFTRTIEIFDWGSTTGLAVSTNIEGQRFRHAVVLLTQEWKQMTRGQQESVWRRVEDAALRSARARGAVV